MPIGSVLAGPLVTAAGENWVLTGSALVLLCSGAAPLFVAGTRQLTRPAPEPGPEPDPAQVPDPAPVPELA